MICEYTDLKLLLSLTEYYMTIECLKQSHMDYYFLAVAMKRATASPKLLLLCSAEESHASLERHGIFRQMRSTILSLKVACVI